MSQHSPLNSSSYSYTAVPRHFFGSSAVAGTRHDPSTPSARSHQQECSGSHSSPEFPFQYCFSPRHLPTLPSASDLAELPSLLGKLISDSLQGYLYQNALFYAERLYDLVPNYQNLHTLGHCYVQSGDVDTAFRMLRSYYPFFEAHVSRPFSAGPCSAQRSDFSRDVIGANVSPATDSTVAGSLPQHWFSFTIPGRRCIGSLKTAPLDTRTALHHDSDGQPVLSHVPVDIQSRWDCQYLLGVCCCRTQCYAEAGKVLEELLRISTRLLEHSEQCHAEQKNAQDEEASDLVAHSICNNDRRSAPYSPSSPPTWHNTIWQRMGELRYWLGVSAKHQCLDHAPSLFWQAVECNPFLFCAFEEYVKTVWRPKEGCLEVYSAGCEEVKQEDESVPVLAQKAVEDALQPQPAGAKFFEYDQNAASVMKKFLLPFATVTYLLSVYNCAAAQQCIKAFPQNLASANASAWLLTQHALAFFHNGEMQSSANIFQALLKAFPWRLNDTALVLYSTALWQLKAESTLSVLAQTLMEQLPFSAVTLCVVANTYSLAKEPRQALAMLERAILIDPFMAYTYNLCGYELLYLNQNNEAAEAFKNAIYRDCHLYVAYAGLGEQYVRDGNIIWAREYFQKAILINPLPAVLNRYAATFHRHGASRDDLEKAYSLYNEAIARHSRNLMAQHQRVEVLLLLGRTSEAYPQLLELVRAYPNEGMLYMTLAKCVQLMRMPEKAIMYYQKAMTVDPRQEGFAKRCIENLVAETNDPE